MRTKDALYTAPSRSLLESIVETLGLENCRKIKSPTEKLTVMDDDNDLLDIATSVIYRTCVGKLLFAFQGPRGFGLRLKGVGQRSQGAKKAQLEVTQACGQVPGGGIGPVPGDVE